MQERGGSKRGRKEEGRGLRPDGQTDVYTCDSRSREMEVARSRPRPQSRGVGGSTGETSRETLLVEGKQGEFGGGPGGGGTSTGSLTPESEDRGYRNGKETRLPGVRGP